MGQFWLILSEIATYGGILAGFGNAKLMALYLLRFTGLSMELVAGTVDVTSRLVMNR